MGSSNSNVMDPSWWRQATVYQIYPRSFCDANGDGIGDLKGITSKVDYMKKLGVDAIWLSPFYPSPLKDGGYDVADYRNVDPRIGTLEDFDEMTTAYKKAGIKIIVDIVPNHSSDEHEWFQEALKSPPGSKARDRYVFRDGSGPDKSEPPSDWTSVFGGSGWERTHDGQYYMHIFDTSQPDFNWSNKEVREDFKKTLRFWADRGVSGFRVDVAHGCAKDVNAPYKTQKELDELLKLNHEGKKNGTHPFWDRDEVHEIFREWREVFDEYDPPLTAVAEAWVAPSRQHLYASPKELGQTFAFDLLQCPYNAQKYRETIDNSLQLAQKSGSSTTWVFSNHDVIRHATRYGIAESTSASVPDGYHAYCEAYLHSRGKDPKCDFELGLKRARAATLMMLALPGSAYVWQGEEMGLPEVVDIPDEKRQDPIFFRTDGKKIGRDGCRVPLPWSTSNSSFGFSPDDAKTEPHLPQPKWWGDYAADKEDQKDGSTLQMYQHALALKHKLQTEEKLDIVKSDEGILRFKRPGGWEVVFNVASKEPVEIKGEVLICSGELVDGKVGENTSVWLKV